MEGLNLLPYCRRGAPNRARTLYWEHEGNRAVRDGDWKLVGLHRGAWELYNVRRDPTELEDLAARERTRARRLESHYDSWAARNGVLPWPVRGN
jgi:arylsulfatase